MCVFSMVFSPLSLSPLFTARVFPGVFSSQGPQGVFSFFISPPPFFQTTRKIFFFFSSSKVLGKLRGPQRATAPAQAGVVPTGAGAGASPFFTFYFSVFFFCAVQFFLEGRM